MKPWKQLGEAASAEGKMIRLKVRDGEFAISVDGVGLMSNREFASEEKLAELACTRLIAKPNSQILIGGLGLGFTLKAALKILPKTASVIVAEILPIIIEWNQNPAYPFASAELTDSRVQLVTGDVGAHISTCEAKYDSILLDVDNGPVALTATHNSRLYDLPGLSRIRRALRPEGTVLVWSIEPSDPFKNLLAKAGFNVEMHKSRAHATAGGKRVIYVGRRP